jgi:hypothetical protein
MSTIAIQAKLQWRGFRDQGTRRWVAVCDPLNVAVEAGTWSELHAAISDSLNLIFRDLLATGELEGFLKDRGWSLQSPLPEKPHNARFDVPYHLTQGRANHAEAAMSY